MKLTDTDPMPFGNKYRGKPMQDIPPIIIIFCGTD
jgi:uncharacterized protein (DUF3820 family)